MGFRVKNKYNTFLERVLNTVIYSCNDNLQLQKWIMGLVIFI